MDFRSKPVKLTLLSAGLLTGVAAVAVAAYPRVPEGIIADGVRVAGMDWSRKDTNAALGELETWSKTRLQEPLTLTLPKEAKHGGKWTPTRADIGAAVDLEGTVGQAAQVGRDETALSRLIGLVKPRKPVEIAPLWRVDKDKLSAYLKKRVAPKANRAPKDARFLATDKSFQIIPDQPGTALDVDAAAKEIADSLTAGKSDPIALPVKIAPPHVTAEDLKGIEGEVSRFRTSYGETGNRAKNILVACSHINGTVLKPGDRFSYNKVVGPRDSDSGFKMAPVIVQGKLQPGMGGGVCQTSSTLYNAVLLADLKIVTRQHHAFPVHYLPAGRDATVAYGDKDFVFENNTDAPIAIASSGKGGEVVMRIFGKKAPGREVTIERSNVSSWGPGVEHIHDDSLRAGSTRVIDKGHAGHRVTVWRIVKMNGRQVKKEVISRDHYDAFPRIVAVGTRQVVRRAPPASAGPVSTPTPAAPSSTLTAGSQAR